MKRIYKLPLTKYTVMLSNLLKTSIGRFRIIAFLEGMSYLILLFIAMPLKYSYNMPIFVKVIGMAHGVFFVLFIFSLADVRMTYKWSVGKIMVSFLASLLPFGTFVLDAKLLKKEMEENK